MKSRYANTCKRCSFFFILSSIFKSRGGDAPALLLSTGSGIPPLEEPRILLHLPDFAAGQSASCFSYTLTRWPSPHIR